MVRSPGGAETAGAAPTCRRRKRAANRRGSRELLRLELLDLAGARRHHAQRPRHGGGGAGAEARSDGAAEPAHLQEHDGEQVAFARESAGLRTAHKNKQLLGVPISRVGAKCLSTPGYPDGHAEELLISTSCAGDCNARPTSSLFIARSGGRKSCAGAAAGARAWARAAGLGGGEANPTRPRSATIIPPPRFGRGGSIAGVDDSALRQRADLQALSAILLESWNELSRGMRTTRRHAAIDREYSRV